MELEKTQRERLERRLLVVNTELTHHRSPGGGGGGGTGVGMGGGVGKPGSAQQVRQHRGQPSEETMRLHKDDEDYDDMVTSASASASPNHHSYLLKGDPPVMFVICTPSPHLYPPLLSPISSITPPPFHPPPL